MESITKLSNTENLYSTGRINLSQLSYFNQFRKKFTDMFYKERSNKEPISIYQYSFLYVPIIFATNVLPLIKVYFNLNNEANKLKFSELFFRLGNITLLNKDNTIISEGLFRNIIKSYSKGFFYLNTSSKMFISNYLMLMSSQIYIVYKLINNSRYYNRENNKDINNESEDISTVNKDLNINYFFSLVSSALFVVRYNSILEFFSKNKIVFNNTNFPSNYNSSSLFKNIPALTTLYGLGIVESFMLLIFQINLTSKIYSKIKKMFKYDLLESEIRDNYRKNKDCDCVVITKDLTSNIRIVNALKSKLSDEKIKELNSPKLPECTDAKLISVFLSSLLTSLFYTPLDNIAYNFVLNKLNLINYNLTNEFNSKIEKGGIKRTIFFNFRWNFGYLLMVNGLISLFRLETDYNNSNLI